jgi:uncharacterized repeat protein (TIGR01451 family)
MSLENRTSAPSKVYAMHKEQPMNFGTRRLFLGLVVALAAISLSGAFAGTADAAAPAIGLHLETPETFETGEQLKFLVEIENIGDAPFNAPLTVENTFPAGVTPVEGTLVNFFGPENHAETVNCSISGQGCFPVVPLGSATRWKLWRAPGKPSTKYRSKAAARSKRRRGKTRCTSGRRNRLPSAALAPR